MGTINRKLGERDRERNGEIKKTEINNDVAKPQASASNERYGHKGVYAQMLLTLLELYIILSSVILPVSLFALVQLLTDGEGGRRREGERTRARERYEDAEGETDG